MQRNWAVSGPGLKLHLVWFYVPCTKKWSIEIDHECHNRILKNVAIKTIDVHPMEPCDLVISVPGVFGVKS